MKELESKLRKLPLTAPPQDLDERVSAQKPEHPTHPARRPQRVPVWLTAAISVVTAGLGFAMGAGLRSGRPAAVSQPRPPIMLQVIYDSPASRNPFDFTSASHFFPAGEVTVSTEILKTKA